MVCFMIHYEGVPLSVLTFYIIWLPWLLVFKRIQEMFNVTDGRDKISGVDLLFLFFDFFSKEFGLA